MAYELVPERDRKEDEYNQFDSFSSALGHVRVVRKREAGVGIEKRGMQGTKLTAEDIAEIAGRAENGCNWRCFSSRWNARVAVCPPWQKDGGHHK